MQYLSSTRDSLATNFHSSRSFSDCLSLQYTSLPMSSSSRGSSKPVGQNDKPKRRGDDVPSTSSTADPVTLNTSAASASATAATTGNNSQEATASTTSATGGSSSTASQSLSGTGVQPSEPTTGAKREQVVVPLNPKAVELMRQWLESHADNPYPSKEEKECLRERGCACGSTVYYEF